MVVGGRVAFNGIKLLVFFFKSFVKFKGCRQEKMDHIMMFDTSRLCFMIFLVKWMDILVGHLKWNGGF